MIINKYKAKTEKEALELAKEELGEAALVLNVKTIKPRGLMKLFKKPVVELTAAIDDNVPTDFDDDKKKSNKKKSDKRETKKDNKSSMSKEENESSDKSEGTPYVFGEAFKKVDENYSEDAQNAIEERINNIAKLLEQQMNLSKKDDKETQVSKDVKNELVKEQTLKSKDDFSAEATGEELPSNDNAEKKNKVVDLIREKLIENEVSEKYVDAIVGELYVDDKKTPLDNILASVYQKIVLKLGKVEPLSFSENKPKIVFFVGNTGVGKTTTMAKLASKCMLEDKKKVALISVDTYRIAAIEQIKTYANILGAPMEVVYTPEEMVNCVEKYKDFDVILVDTAGRSHKNDDQKNDLKSIVDSVEGYEKEVYLVVSATVKYSDLIKISKSYEELFDYKLIFTKLDETSGLGSILNLKLDTKKNLSYVTWGQNVPDDMGVLNPQIIAKKLLGGGE